LFLFLAKNQKGANCELIADIIIKLHVRQGKKLHSDLVPYPSVYTYCHKCISLKHNATLILQY